MGVRTVSLSVAVVLLAVSAALVVRAQVNTAANEFSDCAVDCRPFGGSQGSIQVPTIGAIGGAATFKIDWNARALDNGANELFWVGGYDTTRVSVVWSGSSARYLVEHYGYSMYSEVIPRLTAASPRKWYTVMLTISSSGIGKFYHYEAGAASSVYLSASTSRYIAGLGCAYRTATICGGFNGLIDNFGFWNAEKPQSAITNFPNTPALTAADQSDLIANFLFDECISGTTVAVTPETGGRSQILQSSLQGAVFATKVNDMMRCHGSGDPHYYAWFWDSLPSDLWGKEWAPYDYYMTGTYTLASCRENFEMRTFQRYVSWWPSAAVIRKTSIKANDHYFMVSEDEPDQAQGAFHKYGKNSPWVTLPLGSYYDKNGVYHTWTGSELKLIVPMVGYATVGHSWPQVVNVYLDAAYCSNDNRPIKGICDRDTTTPRNIDFKDDSFGPDPSDPKDPYNPGADPCATASAELVAAMDKVCFALHKDRTSDKYKACKFDVCVTNDPDTPLVGDPTPSCAIQDWLNAHPKSVQPNAALSVQTSCDPCPNFCSFHGTCNSGTGLCACEPGWTGRDCGLPVGFDCYVLSTGAGADLTTRNVQPLVALAGVTDLSQFLSPYNVEDSVLVFPLSKRSSAAWDSASTLSVVIVAGSANSAGSATLTLRFDVATTSFEISPVTAFTRSGNDITFTLKWNFAPISYRVIGLPTAYNMQVQLTNTVGVQQLLIGSGVEGRTQMDVVRVRSADWATWGNVKLTAAACTSSPCDSISNCQDCAANSQCGFCVESGRCMRGDAFGPLRGTCTNWRFTFDSTVSRRVTSQFGFPVNPIKAEVYLTTATSAAGAELPVDISVSTADLGNVWDLLLMLHPRSPSTSSTGIAAFNSKVRFALESQLVPSLMDEKLYPNLGLAISIYGSSVRMLRDFTEVKTDYLYLFGRAIQSISNLNSEPANTQVSSLASIVPAAGASPNWRKNARRLVIISADSAPSTSDMNSMRAALIQHRIFPVVLVNRDSCDATCRNTWNQVITNPNTGIGFGFSMTFDGQYTEYSALVRKAIRLATGQISMTYDRAAPGHIKTDEVASNAESMQLFGLNRNFRGRFSIPFKRASPTDSAMLSATLTAVGFGSATVEDIVTEKPSADNMRLDTLQDQTVAYYLQGRTFRNLLRTLPKILTVPDPNLAELYDSNPDGSIGTKITAGMVLANPSGKIWFVPKQYKHSVTVNGVLQPFVTYSYSVMDGCSESSPATVSHYVGPVNDAPTITGTTPSTLVTDEDTPLPFTVNTIDPDYLPADALTLLFTKMPVNGIIKLSSNGQVVALNKAYPATTQFQFVPNADWWGADSFRIIVRDNGTPSLEQASVVPVTVNPISDAPNAIRTIPYAATPERTTIMVPLSGDDKDRVYGDFNNAKIRIRMIIPAGFKGTLCRVNQTVCTSTLNNGDFVPVELTGAPYAPQVFYTPINGPTEYSCPRGTVAGGSCTTEYTYFSWEVVDASNKVSETIRVPVYVSQVADAPVVPDTRTVGNKENQTFSITLTGTNVEYPGQPMVFRIDSFPKYTTLKRADGTVISSASPIVNANPAGSTSVTIVPDLHLYGVSTSNWLFGSFVYSTYDTWTRSNAGRVDLTVEAVNDPPVTTFSAVSMMEKQSTIFELTATDIDNSQDELTFRIVTGVDPSKGQLFNLDPAAGNKRGTEIKSTNIPYTVAKTTYNGKLSAWLIYVPSGYNNFFYGTDSFGYSVTDVDKFGNSVMNTVYQNVVVDVQRVNDPPTITATVPATLSLDEDTSLGFTISTFDPDYWPGDILTLTFASLPRNGEIRISSASGSLAVTGTAYDKTTTFFYVPKADWWGNDSIRVIVRDNGNPVLDTASVMPITVRAINDAPSANSTLPFLETPEQTTALIPLNGDDKDRIYGDIANSKIYVKLYVPANFNGTLCRINETNCATENKLGDLSLVPVTAINAPLASRIYYTPKTGATEYSCPRGTIAGFNCSTEYDSFSWELVDANAATSARIRVPVYVTQVANPPTVPSGRVVGNKENQTISITLTGTNVEYPGQPLSFRIESFPNHVTIRRADGSVINAASPVVNAVASASSAITIQPDLHLFGVSSSNWLFGTMSYTAFDTWSRSNIGQVNLTVEAVNDPPVTTFTNVTMMEKQSTAFLLTATDIDNTQDQLAFRIVAGVDPTKGELYNLNPAASNLLGTKVSTLPFTITKTTYNGTLGAWLVYVPSGHGGYFYGTDGFQYSVTDQDTYSNSVTNTVYQNVVVKVIGVNDPPTITGTTPSSFSLNEDTSLAFSFSTFDPDYDPGDVLEFIFDRLPASGALKVGTVSGSDVVLGNTYPSSTTFVYVPKADWWGIDSVRVIVRDNGTPMLQTAYIYTFTVAAVNDAPNAIQTVDFVQTPERTPVMIPLAGDDKDRVYGDAANSNIAVRLVIPTDFKGTLCRVNQTVCASPLTNGALIPISKVSAPLSTLVFFIPINSPTEYSCHHDTVPNVNCSTYATFKWEIVDQSDLTSSQITVPIYVTQVPDAPLVPAFHVAGNKENQTITLTLTGTNVEYPGEPLSFRIESFPSFMTIRRADNSVIDAANPDVNANPAASTTITLEPDMHLFGVANQNWLFGSLSYTAVDRYPTRSSAGQFNLTVEAVNDPPVPTANNVTMMEKTPTVFELTAVDIDNIQDDLSFIITQHVNNTKGRLFNFDPTADDLRGAEISGTEVFTVTKTTYNDKFSAWLLYVPSGFDGFFYGQDSFTYAVQDVDTFGNSVQNTVHQAFTITVSPVNDAPVVNTLPFYAFEDTVTTFTLFGEDPWYGEGDTLKAVILRFYTPETSLACRSKMGKLFQYDANNAADNFKGAEIDAFPADVLDSKYRVVYVPEPNMNVNQTVAYTYVEPIVDFYVVETVSHAEPKFLQSRFQSIPIVIAPVNDLPVVLGVQNNQIEACTDVCQYQKNFGRSFRETLGFAGIYFGGNDVEKGSLVPVIVDIRSRSDNFILQTLDPQPILIKRGSVDRNDQSTWIDITRQINLVAPASCNETESPAPFVQGLEFQPGLDEYDSPATGYYLEIDYLVRDENGAYSATAKTITIKVNNTALSPRADSFNQYVTAFQNTPRNFSIRAIDPDRDAFEMIVTSCNGEKGGKFQMIKEDGTQGPVVVCPTANAVTFPSVPIVADGYQEWRMIYTPPTDKVGKTVNQLTLIYNDGRSAVSLLDTYYVITDVQRENLPPVIKVNGETVNPDQALPLSQTGQLSAAVAIDISDPNIPAAAINTKVTTTLTIDNGGHFLLKDGSITNNFTMTATPSNVNSALSALRVNASTGYGFYTFTITVNDNANSGFCAGKTGSEPYVCALETVRSVSIQFVQSVGVVNSVAVGSSAAAAAAVAIIAAGLLYRRISRRPDEGYNPWEFDGDNDTGVVLNPLFETTGTEGDNPLFEGKTDE